MVLRYTIVLKVEIHNLLSVPHSKQNIISSKGFFDLIEDWNDSLYNCF